MSFRYKGDGEIPSIGLLKCFKEAYLDMGFSPKSGMIGH